MSTRVKVRVSYDVWVEPPEEWDDAMIRFDIEENHCPGTGMVGTVVDGVFEHECELDKDESIRGRECWACRRAGENKILEIVRGVKDVKVGDVVRVAGFRGDSTVTKVGDMGFQIDVRASEAGLGNHLRSHWWTIDDLEEAAT